MRSVKINGEALTVRETWEEALTHEFQELVKLKEPTMLDVASVMTGRKYEAIATVKDDLLELKLYKITNFFFNQPRLFTKMPFPETFFGVKIPLQIEKLTIEQNMHMRMHMVPGELLETKISWACAIYLQPLIDKTGFDEKRVEEIEKVIRNMRIYDTYAVGFFILSRLNNSGTSGLLYWFQNLILKIRLMTRLLKKLALRSSSRSMT